MAIDRYALVRPDGTVRALSPDPFDLSYYPGHAQYDYRADWPMLQPQGYAVDSDRRAVVAVQVLADYVAADLAAAVTMLQAELSAQIDAEAEAIRAQYLTLSSGQAMSYVTKAAHAREVLAGTRAVSPILQALVGTEVKADGTVTATLADVATVVDAAATQYETAEGAIDATRRAAKIALDAQAAAHDLVGMRALFPIRWPSLS